jgi:hypothetical protein
MIPFCGLESGGRISTFTHRAIESVACRVQICLYVYVFRRG